jgi:hypothetical protein
LLPSGYGLIAGVSLRLTIWTPAAHLSQTLAASPSSVSGYTNSDVP